jgi:hypothetical protein
MKILALAAAAALALTSSLAFAQTGTTELGAPEGSHSARPARIADPAGTIQADKTIGEAPSRPATPGVVPGSRDKSRVGGEGVNDRPAGK